MHGIEVKNVVVLSYYSYPPIMRKERVNGVTRSATKPSPTSQEPRQNPKSKEKFMPVVSGLHGVNRAFISNKDTT